VKAQLFKEKGNLESNAESKIKLCSQKAANKKNNKASIRQEQIRWANKEVPIIKIDIAMEYVADVLEAEVDILQTTKISEAHQSAAQLVKVIGYLRQQVENLRSR
jgi:hypothetical protein